MSKNIIASLLLSVVGFSASAALPKLPNMMCLQVISNMYNADTKEIKMASNSCQAASLKQEGFSEVSMNFVPDAEVTKPVKKAELLTVIKSGKYQISDVAHDSCTVTGKICSPSTHVIIAQSKLILTLPLQGCLDSAFVTYKISDDEATGVKTVLVSALNVRNEKSATARCIAAPVALKTIDLKASVMDKSLLKVEFVQEIAK